jgi:hypothetical protein
MYVLTFVSDISLAVTDGNALHHWIANSAKLIKRYFQFLKSSEGHNSTYFFSPFDILYNIPTSKAFTTNLNLFKYNWLVIPMVDTTRCVLYITAYPNVNNNRLNSGDWHLAIVSFPWKLTNTPAEQCGIIMFSNVPLSKVEELSK